MRLLPGLSLPCLVLLAACASSGHGPVYGRGDAQRAWTVREGTVVQVSAATIEGRHTVVGTFGGGYVGQTVGHSFGHGAGSDIAGAVGAVAGAVAGQQVEKAATQQKAWEILVEMHPGGEQMAVVQPADQEFATGEKVRVYTRSDGSARVSKM